MMLGISDNSLPLIPELSTKKVRGRAIENFLSDIVCNTKSLQALPDFEANQQNLHLSQWIKRLKSHTNLENVPLNSAETRLEQYPLVIAEHRSYGPVLCKTVPSLLRPIRFETFCLNTGKQLTSGTSRTEELSSVQVFFETLTPDPSLSLLSLGRYVYKPVMKLVRQLAGLMGIISLLISFLFIVNFSILSQIVPSLSMDAFWLAAVLVVIILSALGCAVYINTRLKLYIHSVIDERKELLRLSLVCSLQPRFVADQTATKTLELADLVASSGKQMLEVVMTLIASLLIVPIMVLLFIRLPATLFIFVLTVSFLGAALRAGINIWLYGRQKRLELVDSKVSNTMLQMIRHAPKLGYYGRTEDRLSQWQNQQVNIVEHQSKIDRTDILSDSMSRWMGSLVYLGTMFAVTYGISTSIGTNGTSTLTVSDAFLVFHLVLATYAMMPRFASAIEQLASLRVNWAIASDFIDNVKQSIIPNTKHVCGARAKITCKDLVLPHDCVFDSGTTLSVEILDKSIVQIYGESGTGKTTFLRCLLGEQPPSSGSIRVFGCDPTQLSPFERSRIFAYVSQNVQLMPGTLRDNLLLFSKETINSTNAKNLVSEARIWDVLERVHLDTRLRQLPLGLDTPIVDAKRGFSTGERQRIVLAQSLLKESAILVLDEALSGLPPEIEQDIFLNISECFQQVYFVSHRTHMRTFANMTINLV